MSKEGENKADDKALRKKLVGIVLFVLFILYFIATIIICYKCSISYNIYSNEICCYVVFFLIIFIYLAFYFLLHPKSEEKQGAFSWDSVPGNDNEKLLRFLRADFDIDWVENAEIRKSNDGIIIGISKGENLAGIKMDENKKKAILKTSDGRIYNLKVKTENGKLNIYSSFFIRFKTFIITFIIKRMRFFALLIIFIFIWKSKGISFNDEQLYYWVFSTLAQVFGALLRLLVITITTIIFGFGHDASRKLECLENIKNEAKYLLYPPPGLVLMYSIMALALSQFFISSWFCKVIIIILGIEVPILAISTTPKIMDIFVRCRKEMMEPGTK